MSDLPANEPHEVDDRPALLGRIRPTAAVVFGAIALSTILSMLYEFCCMIAAR
jgi:hypothetical protein